jgi:hypothetical protein
MLGKNLNNEEKLDAIYRMTLENNEILRTVRRQQYFANTLRALYWIVVVGAIGGAYYFIRPVLTVLSENSGKIEETMTQFNQLRDQLPEKKLLDKVINSLKAKESTSTDEQMPDTGVLDETSTTTP